MTPKQDAQIQLGRIDVTFDDALAKEAGVTRPSYSEFCKKTAPGSDLFYVALCFQAVYQRLSELGKENEELRKENAEIRRRMKQYGT